MRVLERVVERFLGDLVQLLPDEGVQALRAFHLQVDLQTASGLRGRRPQLAQMLDRFRIEGAARYPFPVRAVGAILGPGARLGMPVFYAAVADILVTAHFCYVAFTICGELLIIVGALLRWNWVRNLAFRIVHFCSVVLVAVEASTGIPCPLTEWEYRLRELAGQRVEAHISFIARIVRRIIFYDLPPWVFLAAYIGFALLVGLTFVLVRPRWGRSRKSAA